MPTDTGVDGPQQRDTASLWDMLQASLAIVEFTRGVSLEAFRESRLVRRAVERELEITGEAARRVSDACRALHPDLPWSRIIGLRNFIAHVYDAVDDERIWRLAREDIPTLIEQLRRIVPEAPDLHDPPRAPNGQ